MNGKECPISSNKADHEFNIKTSRIKLTIEKDGIEYEFEPIGDITDIVKTKQDIIDIMKRFKIATRPKNMIVVSKSSPRQSEVGLKYRARTNMLDVWSNTRQFLNDEFTAYEYWDALNKAGYKYKESARQVTPYQQATKLISLKQIERISDNPVRWKKLCLETNE